MSQEQFAGEGAAVLLTGNAMHADLGPDVPPGGFLGWMLTGLGQEVDFPVPEGGAGQLTAALVNRLTATGRDRALQCAGGPHRRARPAGGRGRVGRRRDHRCATRGVLADVGAPALYRDLVGEEHLPAQVVADLERFQYDPATFKVDWALSGPIPWRNEVATHAGTVHVCDGMDGFTQVAADLRAGPDPRRVRSCSSVR